MLATRDFLFNEPKGSDFVMSDETGRQLYLHKQVVSASPYLDTYFVTSVGEADRSKMEVSSHEFDALVRLMEWLYTGHLKMIPDLAVEILEVADRFLLLDKMEFPSEDLRQRWRNNFDLDEIAWVYTFFPQYKRFITIVLAENCDKVPVSILETELRGAVTNPVLITLAFYQGRLDILDKYRPDLNILRARLEMIPEDIKLKHLTRNQLVTIERSWTIEWLIAPQKLEKDTLYVRSMSPFVAYRSAYNEGISAMIRHRIIRPEKPIDICNTVYIPGVGIRDIEFVMNESIVNGEYKFSYTISWQFQLPRAYMFCFLTQV